MKAATINYSSSGTAAAAGAGISLAGGIPGIYGLNMAETRGLL